MNTKTKTNVWLWGGDIGVRGATSIEHAAQLVLDDDEARAHIEKELDSVDIGVSVDELIEAAQWTITRVPTAYFASTFVDGWPAPGARTDFDTAPGRGYSRVVWCVTR